MSDTPLTAKQKEHLLTDIEKRYKIPPVKLAPLLDKTKQEYAENEDLYNSNIISPKHLAKIFGDVAIHAKELEHAIDRCHPEAREIIRERFMDKFGCHQRVENLMQMTSDFLRILHHVTCNIKITQEFTDINCNTEVMTRKIKFHRDALAQSLIFSYTELTNREADTGNDFRDFMNYACDYMDIDSKGLHRKYLDLRNRGKLSQD